MLIVPLYQNIPTKLKHGHQPRAFSHLFEIKTLHWILKCLDQGNLVKITKRSEGALNYYVTIKSIEKVLKLGFMFGSIQKICNDSWFHRLSLTWISKKFSETKIQLMKQCNHSVAQLSSSLSWQTDGLLTPLTKFVSYWCFQVLGFF